ncbi:TetR/AcrR family transcriptional regulator [Candidatus Solincola tengchongensis]|uniref:TetR/AcrR family transcriptional regulator n=1 Tax=Candidatus Solincola tengchongensis TaxID=2900693 RepID=UPI002580222E|nr:TetR/AcrR family transcriptional regulator [Candidatus Solincola tengchongensis]
MGSDGTKRRVKGWERPKAGKGRVEGAGGREGLQGARGKDDRRTRIILSCIDVFSRTNYERATTAVLAREAGVAEGTIYKYFSSKKELFLACCRYIEEQLLQRYRAIYRDYREQPLESLKRVGQSYLDFIRENPTMRKFLAFVLNNSYDEDFMRELEEFFTINRLAVEEVIREAQRKGELKPSIDPKIAAWFFVGGYFTLILMAEMDEEAVNDPHFMDKYMAPLFS